MRQFLREIRFAIVDGWKSRGRRKLPVDHSLARTIKETSHVTGGHGGSSLSPRSPQVDQMAAGAENYAKSVDGRGS